MTYDNAGNLTNDTYTGAGSRVYDAENRMIKAWGGNNQWQEYTYDADGQRVRRKVDGVETWQIYGIGGNLLVEYAASGAPASPQKEYGYRNGQLLVTATAPVTAGTGLQAQYFDNMNFTDLKVTRTDATVNFDWAGGSPDPSFGVDTFSVRWQGKVEPQYSQTYTFYTTTDDGVRLWVNGQLLINKWVDQGPTEWSGSIALTAGQRYDIVMEFYENGGGAMAKLSWSSASQPKQIIPQSRLYLPGSSGQVAIEWLIVDQLGTPRMIFDKTGSLAATRRHDYLPFGEEVYANQGLRTGVLGYNGDALRQKFTGYEHDGETGLDYAQARYYSSSQGRFSSPDPLMASAKATDPQTWNRYGYVVNNPLKYIDPSGMIMGKRKDGDFGSISVYEGNIGTWMGSGPQRQETAVVDLVVDQTMGAPGIGTQSEQTALSAEEATKAVRSVVLPMVENNKQCRKFLDGMLSELERTTRVSPIKPNFLSVFNTLSKQVGFVDLSGLVDDYGQTTLIGGNLSIGINFSKAEPTGPFALEITAVHEVFHASATEGLYTEYRMAEAAFNVGARMRILPPLIEAPKKAETQAAKAYNTRLIDQIIFTACKQR